MDAVQKKKASKKKTPDAVIAEPIEVTTEPIEEADDELPVEKKPTALEHGLTIIKARNIDTDSYLGAVKNVKALGLDLIETNALAAEITSNAVNPFAADPHKAVIYLQYLCQNYVKARVKNTLDISLEDLLKTSQADTERNAATDVSKALHKAKDPKVKETAEVIKAKIEKGETLKKGSKVVMAGVIWEREGGDRKKCIEAFQKELGMSLAGSSTYAHGFKSGRWSSAKSPAKPAVKKKKK